MSHHPLPHDPRRPSEESVARYWNRILAPYSKADDRKAWFQLITTAGLFAANWALMLYSLQWSYWITVLLALPAVGLYTRMFIFQHDCGHGSFFKSRKLNHVVGSLIGVLTLTPYFYWRRTHSIHHATAGNLDHREMGDIATITVEEYRARSPWGKLRYRLYRQPLIMLTVGSFYQFFLKHRLPVDAPGQWKQEWASVMGTNVGIAAIVALAWQTIGIEAFLWVQMPINIIGGAWGIWLFYVQHQFEDTYWRGAEEWDFHRAGIEGSSFYDVGPVLHWFSGNIGYHHIHHLASRIPNYNLQRCYREVKELQKVTRLTIPESLRCARLHLWDEASLRLVPFSHLRTIESKTQAARGVMRRLGLIAAALAVAAVPMWADEADRASDPPKDCYNCDEWNQPQAPFRIHGSTYSVGVHGLSTVAVLTSDGVVLFDAGLPQSVATIAANLETIGSSLAAVRLIATSHEHYDHVGGVAGAQRASGATVLARAPGVVALRAGGPSPEDPQAGFGVEENAFPAVTGTVREVADGERIRLGDFEMTAHATPGHTLGATTWSWRSCEGEQCVDVVYADSLNPVAAPGFRYSNNPERVQAFEASIAKVASLPCDIIVSVHPGFTNLYDKLAARERDPKGANPFLDPAGCRTYAADAAERLAGRLAAEREGREP